MPVGLRRQVILVLAEMSLLFAIACGANLVDKSALYDAVAGGVVRMELKEFRFDPAGRSPDPSCDALHDQSRQKGYQGSQLRLAVVRTTLTPKAAASGVQLDTPTPIGRWLAGRDHGNEVARSPRERARKGARRGRSPHA